MIDSNKPQKAEQMVEYLEGYGPHGANAGDIRGMSAMAAALLCGQTVVHGGTKLKVARMIWFDKGDNKCLAPFAITEDGDEIFANGAPTKATYVAHGRRAEDYAAFLADWEVSFAAAQAEKAKHAEIVAAQAAIEAAHVAADAARAKLDELTTEPEPTPLVTEGQLGAASRPGALAAPQTAPAAPVAVAVVAADPVVASTTVPK